MTVLIKIGGSLIPQHVERICSSLNAMTGRHDVVLIAGGGDIADVIRSYRKTLTLSHNTAYAMALLSLDQHAYLLAEVGGFPVFHSLQALKEKQEKPRIFAPSSEFANMAVSDNLDIDRTTSDAIAALVAARLGADLIVATDTDGIYDVDPRHSSDAKLLETVRASELTHATSLDAEAPAVIHRWKVKTWVVNGAEPDRIVKYLSGQRVRGTEVLPE